RPSSRTRRLLRPYRRALCPVKVPEHGLDDSMARENSGASENHFLNLTTALCGGSVTLQLQAKEGSSENKNGSPGSKVEGIAQFGSGQSHWLQGLAAKASSSMNIETGNAQVDSENISKVPR